MREILLTQGKVALVDDLDYEWLSRWKWYAARQSNTFYAVRKSSAMGGAKRRIVFMHREIMQTPEGLETDHVNGDGLDNRRVNLRVASRAENARNRRTTLRFRNAITTSRHRGVSYCISPRHLRRWQARIRHDGRLLHIGFFATEDEAAAAYDRRARELFGEFARVNAA